MRVSWFVSLLMCLWLTAACGTPEPAPPSPQEIVSNAAGRMNEVIGFHFTIDHSGAPAHLDPEGVLSLRRAEGDFVAPDRAQATVRVSAPGFVTDVDVVTIAGRQWQTNVLTGAWEELPPDWGFNPATLFDTDVGLPTLLTSDLTNVELTGQETLAEGPDEVLYLVSGDLAAEGLYELTGGLMGPDMVSVQLWIAPQTFELHRAVVTEPVEGAEEPSLWQVDFSNFGQVVEIDPPISE